MSSLSHITFNRCYVVIQLYYCQNKLRKTFDEMMMVYVSPQEEVSLAHFWLSSLAHLQFFSCPQILIYLDLYYEHTL
jgi:hypothetical protein